MDEAEEEAMFGRKSACQLIMARHDDIVVLPLWTAIGPTFCQNPIDNSLLREGCSKCSDAPQEGQSCQ